MPAPDDPPLAVKADGDALRVTWADGAVTRAPYKRLRDQCPCATCLEARSKPANPFRVLTANELAAGPLRPVKVVPVGHYAYQITWSDGHASGIVTLSALRDLSDPAPES